MLAGRGCAGTTNGQHQIEVRWRGKNGQECRLWCRQCCLEWRLVDVLNQYFETEGE